MVLAVERAINHVRRKRWDKSEIKADDFFETPEYDQFRARWRGDDMEIIPQWLDEGLTGCGPINIPYMFLRTPLHFAWNQIGKIRLSEGLQLEILNRMHS